jgi:hypothetical protein
MDIHRCKSAYWTITLMRKIEYGIDTFGLEKHPSSIVGKRRKTLLRI